ncbi:DUF2884 family protein [Dyella sp. C9]|uniref:DUF2884 family protein n=1 Tax=Dyella sp. C9 TaxID=2202154 RepID=UPI001300896E|nr:DUF2884 family protein [Dyella sp. C9]
MYPQKLAATLALALLLAACGKNAGGTNIANGGIVYRNGEVTLHAAGAPDAVISETGDLVINGKAVAVDEAQRDMLRRYRGTVVDIHTQGIAAGKAGAALALDSVKGAVQSLGGSDSNASQKSAEARTAQVKQTGTRICEDVVAIKAAQDQLAAQLPAFQPYAHILGDRSHEKCSDDHASS